VLLVDQPGELGRRRIHHLVAEGPFQDDDPGSVGERGDELGLHGPGVGAPDAQSVVHGDLLLDPLGVRVVRGVGPLLQHGQQVLQPNVGRFQPHGVAPLCLVVLAWWLPGGFGIP
jgi:hypothetical protein